MLTRAILRNFKRFDSVEIELGNPVVFVGPNDSGKTTALQALALWHCGLRRWLEKRGERPAPEKRPGVTINRRDLIATPVPRANLLWRNLHVREVKKLEGRQITENVRIDVIVEGVSGGATWTCGLEFDYANEESLYCRPLRVGGIEGMPIPEAARGIDLAFLPPMSGLAAVEDRLDPGAVQVRLGEGRTAEVLRNLCYQVWSTDEAVWRDIALRLDALFGVRPEAPVYIPERGQVTMAIRPREGAPRLDLSSAGRGFQQTLLLLAHLAANPGRVLLLDEPDAHLEILRQRQIYQLLTEIATRTRGQIIAATHSEVILNEAADRDLVIAFVGMPHRIDDRGSQVLKSLKEIGFEQYYQAEQTGWVLYLEGSTDLDTLRSLAARLQHPAHACLERPFVHYVGNQPQRARDHFYALREARPDLLGFLICDRIGKALRQDGSLVERAWRRRELENYLCLRSVLMRWAEGDLLESFAAGGGAPSGPLFDQALKLELREAMEKAIGDLERALAVMGKPSPWSEDIKATDEFLDPLFENLFRALGLPNLLRKSDYHRLARHLEPEEIDSEVVEVLDGLAEVAARARPE